MILPIAAIGPAGNLVIAERSRVAGVARIDLMGAISIRHVPASGLHPSYLRSKAALRAAEWDRRRGGRGVRSMHIKQHLVIALSTLLLLTMVRPLAAAETRLDLAEVEAEAGRCVYKASGLAGGVKGRANQVFVVLDAPGACRGQEYTLKLRHGVGREDRAWLATSFTVAEAGLLGVQVDLPSAVSMARRWSLELSGDGVLPVAKRMSLSNAHELSSSGGKVAGASQETKAETSPVVASNSSAVVAPTPKHKLRLRGRVVAVRVVRAKHAGGAASPSRKVVRTTAARKRNGASRPLGVAARKAHGRDVKGRAVARRKRAARRR